MTEQYRGFWICGGAEAILASLLGRVSGWYSTGSVDYERPSRSVVELTRLQFRKMMFDEKETAEIFGLEIARLLLDTGYREFEIARDETKKRFTKQQRFRR